MMKKKDYMMFDYIISKIFLYKLYLFIYLNFILLLNNKNIFILLVKSKYI